MNRIDSLDWQRGLLAFSIMVYHLTGWELFALDSSSLLGRLGIYGVSMFFVLSGLSMAVAYNKYIEDANSSARFFVRRIFRIWPLLWFAVAFATGAAVLAGQSPNWSVVMLNITTTFGFVAPSAYINTGAWSIGNEMAYYALTPLFILAYNKRLAFGNLLTGLAYLIGLWFSSYLLTVDKSLADQWSQYINPFNNLFLYCSGIALYYNARRSVLKAATVPACIALALTAFLVYPVSGDQINIVTGWARAVFCGASVLIVFAFYKSTVRIPRGVSDVLTKLGAASYGIYLLHPIIYRSILFVLKHSGGHLAPWAMIGASIVLTMAAALISLRFLEIPLMLLGKRLTATPLAGGLLYDRTQPPEPDRRAHGVGTL